MSQIAETTDAASLRAATDSPVFQVDSSTTGRARLRLARGTHVALVAVATLVMSGLALPACLVTQPIHFEEPEGFPPSIETPFDTPWRLSEIVRIDASDDETEQDFEVEVRDPDVDQTLEYLVYVDYAGMDLPGVGADRFGEIPTVDPAAGTDRTRRRISFSLPEQATGLSAPGCHRIEMLVSGRFRSQSRQPVADGDLGTAVWWVATQRDGSTVDMVACP